MAKKARSRKTRARSTGRKAARRKPVRKAGAGKRAARRARAARKGRKTRATARKSTARARTRKKALPKRARKPAARGAKRRVAKTRRAAPRKKAAPKARAPRATAKRKVPAGLIRERRTLVEKPSPAQTTQRTDESRYAGAALTGQEELVEKLLEHTETGPAMTGGDLDAIHYEDNEELKLGEKETERDRHRWERDPASAEDYRRDRLKDKK